MLIEQTAHRLHDMLQQYVDVSCMIGIGQGENTAGGMAEACSRAADAMRSRFYRLNDPVIWWQADLCPQTEPETFSTAEARRLLAEGFLRYRLRLSMRLSIWYRASASALDTAQRLCGRPLHRGYSARLSGNERFDIPSRKMPRSHGDLLRWMDLHHMVMSAIGWNDCVRIY